MANVVKVWAFPRGSDTYKDTLNTSNYQIDATARVVYKVQFSDGTATGFEAANAIDPEGHQVAPIFSSYVTSTGAVTDLVCVSRTPTRATESPCYWTVAAEFKNIPPKTPGKWNINIEVTPVTYEQDAWFDVNNTPILSSAYGVFNPTLKRVYYDHDLSISFDAATVDISNIENCEGCYNAGSTIMTVNGVSRTYSMGTLLFETARYSTIFVGPPPYDWKIAYQFRYRKDGWKDVVIDRDYDVLSSNTIGGIPLPGPRVRVVAPRRYGQPSGQPVLLDGNGNELAVPAAGKAIKPVTKTFDMHGPYVFDSLLAGIQ